MEGNGLERPPGIRVKPRWVSLSLDLHLSSVVRKWEGVPHWVLITQCWCNDRDFSVLTAEVAHSCLRPSSGSFLLRDIKCFKAQDVCVEPAAQKCEGRDVRKGHCQFCLGHREHLLSARGALCHVWSWEEMRRASHGRLNIQGDAVNAKFSPYTADMLSGILK